MDNRNHEAQWPAHVYLIVLGAVMGSLMWLRGAASSTTLTWLELLVIIAVLR